MLIIMFIIGILIFSAWIFSVEWRIAGMRKWIDIHGYSDAEKEAEDG